MLAELRRTIDDVSGRERWGDLELLGWMAEGQDIFCEETGYFVDVTTHTIDTVVDQPRYIIPDRLIQVLDIFYGTRRLGRYQEYIKTLPAQPDQSFVFNPTGQTPYVWQADQETGLITLIPTPQEVITLNLRVWRYSEFALDATDVDGQGTDASPEIPARFHRACIQYAAFMAYGGHDAEEGETTKADDHLRRFNKYVSDGKKAKRRFQSEETTVNGNPSYVMR